ncbi:dockerin type I domain-containing protein [Stieleria sp. JC731]|uniref:dockerin type I domain-containing protein n=1 Tax=Pirellulaceae TaxID=2691357 RepID=UPI001E49AF3B|nr:dockerin type I domain-containing protein [Stieleria sp. JC731]MCC9599403.1 dockerin type I domain-containing protein [Stieleria sp. JC731]
MKLFSKRHQKIRRQRQKTFQTLESRRLLAADSAWQSPWSNPLNPNDVNGDQEVTPRDALAVINRIAKTSSDDAIEAKVRPPILDGAMTFGDVNSDRQITPIDALNVINAIASDVADGESPSTLQTSFEEQVDLVFTEDFSRTASQLSAQHPRQQFRLTATRDNVAVDLLSLQDESLAELRVLDEFGDEVISTATTPGRSRYEGIKFPSVPGRTYYVVTSLNPERADSFSFTLDVMQFDLGQWPGVVISDDPALEWTNARGLDSDLGNDRHSDHPSEGTVMRPFERQIAFQSNIDQAGDADWLRIQTVRDSMSFWVSGQDGQPMSVDVFDTDLNPIEAIRPVEHVTSTFYGVYPTPRQSELLVRIQSDANSIGEYHATIRDVGSNEIANGPSIETGLEDIVGDTLETASDIAMTAPTLQIDHRLEEPGDVDIFRIPNALPGSLIATGVTGIEVDLLNHKGEVIPRSEMLIGRQLSYDVGYYDAPIVDQTDDDAKAVYVRVLSSENAIGRYQLSFAFSGQIPEVPAGFDPVDPFAAGNNPDSAFGFDQHGPDPDSATELTGANPISVISHLDTSEDIDTFSISGYAGKVSFSLSVYSQTDLGINLRLTDFLGNEITPDRFYQDDHVVGMALVDYEIPEYTDASGNPHTRVYVSVSSDNGSTGQYAVVSLKGSSYSIIGVDDHASSFEQATVVEPLITNRNVTGQFDEPTDRDAFRFTATSDQILIEMRRLADRLAMSGQGTFALYDEDGNEVVASVVEEQPTSGILDRIAKTYPLAIGSDYVVVFYNQQEDLIGSYQATLSPLGNVLDSIDTSSAQEILIPEGESVTESISGELQEPGDLHLYRLTTTAYLVETDFIEGVIDANPNDDVKFSLYREHDGTLMEVARPNYGLATFLPDSALAGVGSYVLGVELPSGSPHSNAAYRIDLKFRGVRVSNAQDVGNSIEDASHLTPYSGDGESLVYSEKLELNGTSDVDVFAVKPTNSTLGVRLIGYGPDWRLMLDNATTVSEVMNLVLVSSSGEVVSAISTETVSVPWGEEYQLQFDVEAEQTYYLKVSQNLDRWVTIPMLVQWQ